MYCDPWRRRRGCSTSSCESAALGIVISNSIGMAVCITRAANVAAAEVEVVKKRYFATF